MESRELAVRLESALEPNNPDIDVAFELVFEHALQEKELHLEFSNSEGLRICAKRTQAAAFGIFGLQAKFRALLATVAQRVLVNGGQGTHYEGAGDIEFRSGPEPVTITVSYANTPDIQRLDIEVLSYPERASDL